MTKYKDDLTYEYVSSRLNYNPETGILTWKDDGYSKYPNKEAGSKGEAGYKRLGFRGTNSRQHTRQYLAHRIAWLLYYQSWPKGVIDHINGDRSDNRIVNLRDVTPAENSQNKRKRKTHSAENAVSLSEVRACLSKINTSLLDFDSLLQLSKAIKLLSQV